MHHAHACAHLSRCCQEGVLAWCGERVVWWGTDGLDRWLTMLWGTPCAACCCGCHRVDAAPLMCSEIKETTSLLWGSMLATHHSTSMVVFDQPAFDHRRLFAFLRLPSSLCYT